LVSITHYSAISADVERPLSLVIAPLPNSIGITAVADRRPRQESDSRHKPDSDQPDTNDDNAENHARKTHLPAPQTEPDLTMPAETLFATTLMAIEMLPRALSQNELKLRNNQNWLPPYSAMRLRDRLI
jgi:hypothetical protein